MSSVPNIMFTAGDYGGRKGGKWYRQKQRRAKYSRKRKYRTIMLDRRKDRQGISPWSHTTENAGQGVHPPTSTHQWPGSSRGDGYEPVSPPHFFEGAWLGSRPQLGTMRSAPGTAFAHSPAGQTPGSSQ